MHGARKVRRSGFGWQALLILLPVAVLAALGFHALRQDRRLVDQDAVQRAQGIADELLPKLWLAFQDTNLVVKADERRIKFNESGELISPAPPPGPPEPKPLDLSQLSAGQLELWTALNRELEAPTNASIEKLLGDLFATEPPPRLAALAKLRVAQSLVSIGKKEEALTLFSDLLQTNLDEVTEAGLPISTFSEFNIVSLETGGSIAEAKSRRLSALCSNLVYAPTFLTPYLLEKLEEEDASNTVASWQSIWTAQRLHYERFKIAGQGFGSSFSNVPFVWSARTDSQRTTNSTTQRFLAVRIGDAFYARSESEVAEKLRHVIEELRTVPDYLGVGVELDGVQPLELRAMLHQWKEVHYMGRKGGGLRKEYGEQEATNVLASATEPRTTQAPFKVVVYLTNPSALYQRQQAREFWFGGLIAMSALASVVGLFATWRAFRRQERLAELKTNFVSSVSHELRSPIASVRLMAESLETGKIEGAPKQSEYFHFIGLECRRLSSLIENILDFSRIEQGRKQYEFEPTDIVGLVNQTVTTMRTYAEERGVKLELKAEANVTPAAIELVIDGRALQQALVNLFDNAIKHSAPGQVVSCSVGLRVPSGADNGQALCISISDQGPGIPESEHEKIFERFYRLGSELRRETQGVGIGLSIVKHIVDAHEGKVMVESKPGNGSRFIIELPAKLTTTN